MSSSSSSEDDADVAAESRRRGRADSPDVEAESRRRARADSPDDADVAAQSRRHGRADSPDVEAESRRRARADSRHDADVAAESRRRDRHAQSDEAEIDRAAGCARCEREQTADLAQQRIEHDREVAEIVRTADEAMRELRLELDEDQHRSAALAAKLIALRSRGTSSEATGAKLCELLASVVGRASPVDVSVLEHILRHIDQPGAKYSDFVADFAVHFSNVLGMVEYLTLADILHLPKETWVKSQRRILRELVHLGWMFRQLDLWCMSHNDEMYISGNDATRVLAKMEAVVIAPSTNFLLGGSFPGDPRRHPRLAQLKQIPTTFDGLRKEIDSLVAADDVAVNVMLFGVHCATDPSRPMMVLNVYPCARSHTTLVNQVHEWAFMMYWSAHYEDGSPRPREFIPKLVGASTDSCGQELGAALYLMTPNQAEIDAGCATLAAIVLWYASTRGWSTRGGARGEEHAGRSTRGGAPRS